MKISAFKVPSWLLKSLNQREKVNYSFDALLGTFIILGFKEGNLSVSVQGVAFIMGIFFIIGCFIYCQRANESKDMDP